jgi:osmotically-inducible protein OsmY
MKRQGIRFLLGALAALLAAGCSQETIESAKQDIDRNTETVEREAKRIERQAKPVIEAAKPVVKPVAEAVGRAADRKLDQAKIGGRVLAALRVNANLPKTIRVDADADGEGVKLRGTVKTEEQKRLAERIARDTLGKDKSVQNDLKVEPE